MNIRFNAPMGRQETMSVSDYVVGHLQQEDGGIAERALDERALDTSNVLMEAFALLIETLADTGHLNARDVARVISAYDSNPKMDREVELPT